MSDEALIADLKELSMMLFASRKDGAYLLLGCASDRIAELLAERVALRAACEATIAGWGHQDGVSRAVGLARVALDTSGS